MLPYYDNNNVIFNIAFSNKASNPKMFFLLFAKGKTFYDATITYSAKLLLTSHR